MTDEQPIQPVLSKVEPPAVSKPVPPVLSAVEGSAAGPEFNRRVEGVEPPVVSKVEPPVVSKTEPPVVSRVEPPVVSKPVPSAVEGVEPPVVSKVEPPKGRFEAKVAFHKKLNERFYRLGLHLEGHGAEAFEKTIPGQFAQFDVSSIATPAPAAIPEGLRDVSTRQVLLRRPFSFARVVKEKNVTTIEVLYQVLGPGTVRMTTLAKGDVISFRQWLFSPAG
jgi:hypothetical protein